MAKLTLSEAARACNVARTTIQRAVKTGRLSLDTEHRIDTAELLRVGYQLDAAAYSSASQCAQVVGRPAARAGATETSCISTGAVRLQRRILTEAYSGQSSGQYTPVGSVRSRGAAAPSRRCPASQPPCCAASCWACFPWRFAAAAWLPRGAIVRK